MLKQAFAITIVNLKTLPERWGPSLVIIVGLAGVVGVLVALLAMSAGFESTLKATGRTDYAIVLRGGSNAELNSGLDRDSANLIKQAAGIRQGSDGQSLASAEMVVIAELLRPGQTTGANIALRGVEPNAFVMRPQVKLIEGRLFQNGLREIIVGRGVTRQFQGANLGQTLRFRGSEWTVVGIFESGDVHESELWVDAQVAQSTFGRQGFSSVLLALDNVAALQTLKDTYKADPRLNVDVQSEQDYYDGQTRNFKATIGVLAGVVTVMMALGAIFGALNTMYAAVATRARDIATLRAIGFGSFSVVSSVMAESMLLALLGGLVGAVLAYLLFNGLSVSTLGANFTQVVFDFKVTFSLVVDGLMIALVIGFVGGFLPAVSAARTPITTALRAG
jgi:putative ABC transport system permease protein